MRTKITKLDYLVGDFIMDKGRQKRRLENKLDTVSGKEYKNIEAEILSINEEVLIVKHGNDCPTSAWEYFTGERDKEPTEFELKTQSIALGKMSYSTRKMLSYIIIFIIILVVLFI